MRIIQTKETLWEVDAIAFTHHAYSDYEDWVENGGDGTTSGFVKASVAEFGTELYDLKLIESDTTYSYPEDDE